MRGGSLPWNASTRSSTPGVVRNNSQCFISNIASARVHRIGGCAYNTKARDGFHINAKKSAIQNLSRFALHVALRDGDGPSDARGVSKNEINPPDQQDLWTIVWKALRDSKVKNALHAWQLIASALFVVLYVWSTYQLPQIGSWRYNLDIVLCVFFAWDYIARLLESDNIFKSALSPQNILDLLSFGPSLLECVLEEFSLPFGIIDFHWFRIFRAMRILRLSLIALNLSNMQHQTNTSVLTGAVRVRVAQLIGSVLVLLFTATSVIHLVERMPWHSALYFVVTTLTTVGFGDVVVETVFGKLVVVVMMLVGVAIIPVKASQLYRQLNSRRVIQGGLPNGRKPFVLVSAKLMDVRSFSDFFTEFFVESSRTQWKSLANNLQMVCLCKKPSFEFKAFQEANDSTLSLVEGSAFTETDLVQCQAHTAEACLLLADRFSSNGKQEDLGILFQIWAVKSYTKSVPLYVQVLQSSSIPRMSPFLDPAQDVIISLEQIRHRLLVLSCLCPGAGALIGNLVRISDVPQPKFKEGLLAGRRWLRSYVNGCAWGLFETHVGGATVDRTFFEVAEFVYRSSGVMVIGIKNEDAQVVVNPAQRHIRATDSLVVISRSQEDADRVARLQYTEPIDVLEMFGDESDDDNESDKNESQGYLQEQQEECIPLVAPDAGLYDPLDAPCVPPELLSDDELLDQKVLNIWDKTMDYGNPGLPRNGNGSLAERFATEFADDEDDDSDVVRAGRVKGAEMAVLEEESEPAVTPGNLSDLTDHVVLCGAPESFLPFLQELRRSMHFLVPIVILHQGRGAPGLQAALKLGNVYYVKGSPASKKDLQKARADHARSLMYLCHSQRPSGSTKAETAVLADAEALLTAFGVGVDQVHAVVELSYTSSIRFLQPGLLQKSNLVLDGDVPKEKGPRRSWDVRKQQMQAARDEGLAEWQANPYYGAGRVLVPALLDALACQSFFNKGLWIDMMAEFTGDMGQRGGALLCQIPLPDVFAGKTYRQLVSYLALKRKLVPMGLLRKKPDNPAWLLPYVETNPEGHEVLLPTDRVFVLRERGSK